MSEATNRPLDARRIAVVCAHFSPELGYQEVDLANAFARLGAAVRVVTSSALSVNARTVLDSAYAPGATIADGYEIVRLAPRLTLGPNVIARGVREAVESFQPTHVVLVGPGKLFGTRLFGARRAPWARIAIVQDNSEDGRSRARGIARSGRALAARVTKRPVYRRVARNADRVILNVPETRELVSAWLRRRERSAFEEKALDLRLGFDPAVFYFDAQARADWRRRHGVGDEELVITTCTRATPAKRLERVVDAVAELRRDGVPIRYVLAGVPDDPYGRSLRERVGRTSDAVLLQGPLRHDAMRALFCGSDLGYWPQAAISIQQALGTGLAMLLRRTPTVSHLLVDGTNGWYAAEQRSLADNIRDAAANILTLDGRSHAATRSERAAFNAEYLSYDRVALEIVR